MARAVPQRSSRGRVLPFELVRFPFAFDTPGVSSGEGVEISYKPAPGDVILTAAVAVYVAWDGTTPAFFCGDLLNQVTVAADSGTTGVTHAFNGSPGVPAGVIIGRAVWRLGVTVDGQPGGGDPGSTQGEGELFIWLSNA